MLSPDTLHDTDVELPELRQDLRLVGRSDDLEGEQQWMIYDPAQHRFVGLDRKSFAMIEAWPGAKTPAEIIASAWQRRAEIVTPADVASLAGMLLQSGLAVPADTDRRLSALRASAAKKPGAASALLHNYLFFRVPLFNPENILRALLPWLRPVATRRSAWLLAAVGTCGLALASREWDTFTSSVAGLASLQGAIWLAIALLAAKLLHEFGHALVAAHYGCRVPALGVAFVLGAPLLYVDVSDAWRLPSVRARTAINAAGVATDISVAALSLVLWAFLPSGIGKDIALAFATTGWIVSLAINLNPFMKFDGYHIVADLVGASNLQPRATAMAQWWLRELLFAAGAEAPEPCAPRTRSALVAFGIAAWIYRVVLFTGIAVAVYYYFFKTLGLLLFAVEIGYFIVLPVLREIQVWASSRKLLFRSKRWMVSASVLLALIAVMLVPWSSTIYVPAVLEPAAIARIHVPRPARLFDASVAQGQSVSSGSPLARLMSPDLQHEREIVRLKSAVVELRLARIAGDAADRESVSILQRELASLREQQAGLAQSAAALHLTAPSTGRLTAVAEYLQLGRWLTPDEPLTVIQSSGDWEIRGLVDGASLSRIRKGDVATFVPDDLASTSLTAVVTDVSRANAPSIEQIELASTYGGRIPARTGSRSQPVPIEPQYAVRAKLRPAEMGRGDFAPRVGILVVSGRTASLATRLWNRIVQVLIRESGF